jgi:hypothetical protein
VGIARLAETRRWRRWQWRRRRRRNVIDDDDDLVFADVGVHGDVDGYDEICGEPLIVSCISTRCVKCAFGRAARNHQRSNHQGYRYAWRHYAGVSRVAKHASIGSRNFAATPTNPKHAAPRGGASRAACDASASSQWANARRFACDATEAARHLPGSVICRARPSPKSRESLFYPLLSLDRFCAVS